MALTDAEADRIAARLTAMPPLVVRQTGAAIVAILEVTPGEWVYQTPLSNLARGLMMQTDRNDPVPAVEGIRDALTTRGVVEYREEGVAKLWRVPRRREG